MITIHRCNTSTLTQKRKKKSDKSTQEILLPVQWIDDISTDTVENCKQLATTRFDWLCLLFSLYHLRGLVTNNPHCNCTIHWYTKYILRKGPNVQISGAWIILRNLDSLWIYSNWSVMGHNFYFDKRDTETRNWNNILFLTQIINVNRKVLRWAQRWTLTFVKHNRIPVEIKSC